MAMDIGAIGNLLKIFDQLDKGGQRGIAVFNTFRQALIDNGFAADTAALDAVIEDATRREALARQQAEG